MRNYDDIESQIKTATSEYILLSFILQPESFKSNSYTYKARYLVILFALKRFFKINLNTTVLQCITTRCNQYKANANLPEPLKYIS